MATGEVPYIGTQDLAARRRRKILGVPQETMYAALYGLSRQTPPGAGPVESFKTGLSGFLEGQNAYQAREDARSQTSYQNLIRMLTATSAMNRARTSGGVEPTELQRNYEWASGLPSGDKAAVLNRLLGIREPELSTPERIQARIKAMTDAGFPPTPDEQRRMWLGFAMGNQGGAGSGVDREGRPLAYRAQANDLNAALGMLFPSKMNPQQQQALADLMVIAPRFAPQTSVTERNQDFTGSGTATTFHQNPFLHALLSGQSLSPGDLYNRRSEEEVEAQSLQEFRNDIYEFLLDNKGNLKAAAKEAKEMFHEKGITNQDGWVNNSVRMILEGRAGAGR